MNDDLKQVYQEEAVKLAKQYDKLLFTWSTGVGKSKAFIMTQKELNPNKTLLVVAERAHIDNWKKEYIKWGAEDLLKKTDIFCWASLKKHCSEETDLLGLDECFRGDTEVLTNKGFKRFDSLDRTEKIAQYTSNGKIDFVTPLNYIKRDFVGDICKLHLQRNRYCYMTPNHNQVYKTKGSFSLNTVPINTLKCNNYTLIPVSGVNFKLESIITPLERLYIAIQADGTLQKHQINEDTYSIGVTKQRKKDRLIYILKQTKNYTVIKGKNGTDRYICKLPKGDAKLLSTHFTVDMGYVRANSFIDEIVEWDGSRTMGNTLYYSSKIKENADFVAAVAVQAGYKVLQDVEEDNRKETYSNIHRVYMRKVSFITTQSFKKYYEPYNGKVYCVEVPSHNIVVRSQGFTFITGNCHHISEKRLDYLVTIKAKKIIGLTATLNKERRLLLESIYGRFERFHISLREAIKKDMLPAPKIIAVPMNLDNTKRTETIIINSGAKAKRVNKECSYSEVDIYLKKYYNVTLTVKCTQLEKYLFLCSEMDKYKNIYMRTNKPWAKFKWLGAGSERKRFLAECKTEKAYKILSGLGGRRLICFCGSINQADMLGGLNNVIHSKKKDSLSIINRFNQKKINSLFAVNMLQEGQNLVDIQVGVIVQLDGEERSFIQRLGRILRAENPIVYILYYRGTRDEEFFNNAIDKVDSSYITYLKNE